MKALKTIVATAVIVFALTTVAMAGARHVAGSDDAAKHAASPAATQTHHSAGATLTDAQFARLMHAVNGQAARQHTPQAGRETTRACVRSHSRQTAGDSAIHEQVQHRTQSQGSSSATHDGGTMHAVGATHDAGTQHDGGTHHGGGTHDTGTHHDGGTCNE